MSSVPTCVVLAGGLGTRIRSVLPDLPKPMAPFCGKPFLEWVIRFLVKQGIREFFISAGYKGDVVAEYFHRVKIPGCQISIVIEKTPQGTAGGFWEAYQSIKTPAKNYLVVNADSLVLTEIQDLWNLGAEDNASLLAVFQTDSARYGTVIFDQEMHLKHFKEKVPGSGYINAGVYCLKGDTVPDFPSQRPLGFEQDVFPDWLKKKRTIKVVSKEQVPFLDMGTPESFATAENFINQHRDWFAS